MSRACGGRRPLRACGAEDADDALLEVRAPSQWKEGEKARSPATEIQQIGLRGLPEERCREVEHAALSVDEDAVAAAAAGVKVRPVTGKSATETSSDGRKATEMSSDHRRRCLSWLDLRRNKRDVSAIGAAASWCAGPVLKAMTIAATRLLTVELPGSGRLAPPAVPLWPSPLLRRVEVGAAGGSEIFFTALGELTRTSATVGCRLNG